ncbi:MAG: CopD family protein, partial [Chloroflexi bacterium]|nr:CopD family protein [Chloroflexota bacterium]
VTLVRLLGGALLVSAAATLAVATLAALETGSTVDYLFGARNGMLQTARAAVAAAGGAMLLLVAPRAAGAVAAATGLVGIILLVASGHSAAVPGVASLISQVVHVAGAGVWIGGIVGLLALVRWPVLLTGAHRRRLELRETVPRFSALALVSIGLVGLTGVHAAWTQTGTLLPVGTEYGRTLIMKSAFAAGALALGGLNFLDGGRMMGWLDGFRSRITIEVMLAAIVLVLTASLAITPPAEEAAGVPIESVPDAFGEVAPDVTMEVFPGRPGVNRIVVTTIEAMAGRTALQLGLDNTADGTTTLVPLELEGDGIGMSHGSGDGDGTLEWTANAVGLPPDSTWDASVRVNNADGVEIWRQRFAFALDDDGIEDGEVASLLDPAAGVAGLLLLGGALGLGLGLGGARLPRCEAVASRVALIGGGTVAAALGVLIGLTKLVG